MFAVFWGIFAAVAGFLVGEKFFDGEKIYQILIFVLVATPGWLVVVGLIGYMMIMPRLCLLRLRVQGLELVWGWPLNLRSKPTLIPYGKFIKVTGENSFTDTAFFDIFNAMRFGRFSYVKDGVADDTLIFHLAGQETIKLSGIDCVFAKSVLRELLGRLNAKRKMKIEFRYDKRF